jgi:hypothetical protein
VVGHTHRAHGTGLAIMETLEVAINLLLRAFFVILDLIADSWILSNPINFRVHHAMTNSYGVVIIP